MAQRRVFRRSANHGGRGVRNWVEAGIRRRTPGERAIPRLRGAGAAGFGRTVRGYQTSRKSTARARAPTPRTAGHPVVNDGPEEVILPEVPPESGVELDGRDVDRLRRRAAGLPRAHPRPGRPAPAGGPATPTCTRAPRSFTSTTCTRSPATAARPPRRRLPTLLEDRRYRCRSSTRAASCTARRRSWPRSSVKRPRAPACPAHAHGRVPGSAARAAGRRRHPRPGGGVRAVGRHRPANDPGRAMDPVA